MRHLLLVAILATPAFAQLQPGTFLTLTSGTAADRSVQIVDRFAGTSTPLTIQGVPWATHDPADTFIEDENNFLLATVDSSNPLVGTFGDVFRVTFAKGAWTATQLNTTRTNPRTVDVERIGGFIYLAGGTGGNGSANDGQVYRMPAAGGAPTVYVALGNQCRPTPGPAVGICGTLTAVGTTLHSLMWDAAQQAGVEHWAIDTAKTPPAVTKVGNLLPASKRWCAALPLLPVQATFDPGCYQRAGGALVIGGRMGEILWRDLQGNDLFHSVLPGQPNCTNTPMTELMNSCAINTSTGAVLMGDFAANLEELIGDEYGAWTPDVQTLPVPAAARVTNLEYTDCKASCRKESNGCMQSGTNSPIPCIYLNSLPRAGTPDFALTLATNAASRWALAILGDYLIRVDLKNYGAPLCWVWPAPVVAIPGRPAKNGFLAPFGPIPACCLGLQAHVQWFMEDSAAPNQNALGLVVSDACLLTVGR